MNPQPSHEHPNAPVSDAGIDGVGPEQVVEAMRESGLLSEPIPDIRTCWGLRLTYAEFRVVAEAIRQAYRTGRFRPADYHYPEAAAVAGICREWMASQTQDANAGGAR